MRANARAPAGNGEYARRDLLLNLFGERRSFQRQYGLESDRCNYFSRTRYGRKHEGPLRYRNDDDNETNAGRHVVGAVKYQRTREFSRGVNCMLGKTCTENRGELIHCEYHLLIRRELIAL